ncbi:hypothetical protein [Qipengyuania marisflavi]|uniref:hypothetical protein n=1 Tax=Qipengyuania marisflavi TaxID=2486356 RepID=UPI001486161B|nr:hypothetical protein [Qipengyuania marisflavi]
MNSLLENNTGKHQKVRMAVIAASLAVIGCFTAALTLVEEPVQAAPVKTAAAR